MQRWDNKKATEVVTRTYVLPKVMRDAGLTITGCAVGQALYAFSSSAPSPDMLAGARQINAAPINYKGQTIAAGQAVLQNLQGGAQGCEYVITFTMTLSDGETFIEDCLQPVSQYVP